MDSGKLGDVVIVDPHKKWQIKGKELHSKCGWSPFEGFNLHGKVSKTIIGGKVVVNGE